MDSTMDELGNGVRREWLHGRRIVVFSAQEDGKAMADRLAAGIIEIAKQWVVCADRPYLAVYDFSNIKITPYGREKMKEAAAAFPPNMWGYSAIVIPKTPISAMFRIFANRDLTNPHTIGMTRGFFFSRDEALVWLESHLHDQQTAAAGS